MLHAWLAGARTDAWFEYVPTDANVADEPSRDLSLAGRVFRFAPGLCSVPVPVVRFPPLGSLDDPAGWMREARGAAAMRG